MKPWTVEYGTLWAWEPAGRPPPAYQPRVRAEFVELGAAECDELAIAMALSTPEPVSQRLDAGRRCFGLRIAGQLAAYGWVTQGPEHVGELEREFRVHDDESYVWDCGTVPQWRGQGCYSALLNQIIFRLHGEKVARIWIGASRLNRPSVRGMANAGFQSVVDITYRRMLRITALHFHDEHSRSPLVAAAYRVMTADHERRFRNLAVGILPTA